MKLSVEFPSVSYREGPAAVADLARAIERIGYDHIDIFDHVVMGVPIEGRPRGPYNAAMPILEALMALSYIAAVTTRVTLGTEVLVLPQRQPHAGGQAGEHARHALGRPGAARRGRRLAGVGVRGPRRALPDAGRAHGRGHPPAARLLDRRRGELRERALPDGVHGHGAQAAAGRPACRSGSAASRRPRSAAWAGSATAGWPAGSPTRPARARPSRPSIATPRPPGAIPAPSGCRAWWRRRPATRRARPSTPTTTRWWPASPRSRPWASAGSRSTPPRSSRPARAPWRR